ncbi:MAG TPA: DNA polymerase III subunit epsilon [Dokdonella sp.]|nr:DNA polymerase III subunit epsilon [Dokdonella sp.]
MRQVVLDTETTGLDVRKGHRVIEIGCVELLERRLSGRTFHAYLNPDRAIDEGARAVHGIDDTFLVDKPRFGDIVGEFLAFVAGAEIIAHNASFDVGFLDAEIALTRNGHGSLREQSAILDTLQLAREKYPGQQNSLNALCKRLGIDNRHRELHGALIDAHLLADVYLAMTTGQGDLGLAVEIEEHANVRAASSVALAGIALRVQRASPAELEAHLGRIESIDRKSGGRCVWKR